MKIPEPRKLKSGSYFIQLRLGGVSVPVTASTAKECKRMAALIKAEHRAGARTVTAAEKRTLAEITQAYLNKHEAVLSPSTVRGWDSYRQHRFASYQQTPVGKIDFQQMINDETALVSPKTVKCAWGFVAKALRDEAGIDPPKVRLPQVPVKEVPFLQPEEIRPFLAAIKGNIAETAALLELHGLRRSEVLGLRWEDVDLEKKLLNIRGATVQNKEGEFVRKETNKNASSTRTVPIMIPRLYDLLKAEPDQTGAVVRIAANTMLRNIKDACKAAGLTEVGNHGLRHSFASLGYHLGLSERELMQLGGWADFQTMHKIYVRVAAQDAKAAQNKMSDFFKNANENANDSQKPA